MNEQFEKIIGRKEIIPSLKEDFWQDKVVLIVGLGTVGSALLYELYPTAKKILIVEKDEERLFWAKKHFEDLFGDREEVSFFQKDGLGIDLSFLEKNWVNVVINTAANKHVDLCQQNKENAFKNNTLLAQKLANLCYLQGSFLCHLSTDKVPSVKNYYALTKLMAERAIDSFRKIGLQCCIIRFANVFNSSGSVIKIWERDLKNNNSILDVNNHRRWFISIREASSHVLLAIEESIYTNNYLFAIKPREETKIMAMAKEFCKLKGIEPRKFDSVESNIHNHREKFVFDFQKLVYCKGLLYIIKREDNKSEDSLL